MKRILKLDEPTIPDDLDPVHASFMQRCLDLASLGLGKVSPNPMVGAVVVLGGKIIGEGWHRFYGGAHAEVNAINEALLYLNKQYPLESDESSHRKFKETFLYVCLEPCSHFGKTPPCADLIIDHNIGSVIIGCEDPNPLVAGKGVLKLVNAGIEVKLGVLEKECKRLNRRFFTYTKEKRPYVILKWAETQNGYLAPLTREPYWISSDLTQRINHRWRTEEDAILIGKRTAIQDNPTLTARYWEGRNPKRVLFDWDLEVPSEFHIYNEEAKTFLINGKKDGDSANIQYVQLENKEYLLQYSLYQLFLNDIGSLLVEGGAYTINQFIELNLWDEIRVIRSPPNFRSGLIAPQIPDLYLKQNYRIDKDEIIMGFNPISIND